MLFFNSIHYTTAYFDNIVYDIKDNKTEKSHDRYLERFINMRIIKKVVFILCLVMVSIIVINGFQDVKAAKNTDWKKMYKEFLEENRYVIYNCECGYINDDDIPELIYNLQEDANGGWFAPTAPVYITTIASDGKLISFSALPERTYGQLYFYEKSGIATCGDMQQGYIWGKVYQFDKNWNAKEIKSFSSYELESDFIIDGKTYTKSNYEKETAAISSNYEKKYGAKKCLPEKNLLDYYIYKFTDPSEIEIGKLKVKLEQINNGTGVNIVIGNTRGANRYYLYMTAAENENSAYMPYDGNYTRFLGSLDAFDEKEHVYTINGLPKGKYTFCVEAYSKWISVYNEEGYYETEDCRSTSVTKSIKIKAASIKNEECAYNFSTVKKWDIIKFGKYEQDGIMTNGKEDIEWIVLSKKKGKLFVVSKNVLDCLPYNKELYKDVTWETSTIRTWLNKAFYKNAFTKTERDRICKVKIENPDNPDYYTEGGAKTKDKVFLLSTDEINNSGYGFSTCFREEDSKRQCIPTAYAKALGVRTNAWLLRTPGAYADAVSYVTSFGMVDIEGIDIGISFMGYDSEDSVRGLADRPGIRPAMYISIE